jgi:hypothetical protein
MSWGASVDRTNRTRPQARDLGPRLPKSCHSPTGVLLT